MNSRNKGKVGELEFAKYLRERGHHEARRGQQYSGGSDSPDVVGIPGIHFERKRTERLGLYDALDQAVRDAGPDSVPVVAHRCNSDRKLDTCRGVEIAILRMDDFLDIWEELHGKPTA